MLNNKEPFKSEYRESDIFLPAPVPQFQYELEPKNELIISKLDKNNNFPIDKYVKPIDPPVRKEQEVNKNSAFDDVKFNRDTGVIDAMNNKKKINDGDYIKASDIISKFDYPVNSKNLLTKSNIKSSDEIKDIIHNVYDNNVSKVKSNISSEQIDSITGKKYMINDESNVSLVYKPLYASFDKNA
jgi:hypothetical protein